MTQQEFTQRTGLVVSAQEYVEVENTYMAIGDDIDKDMFCALWINKEELSKVMTSRAIEYQRQKEYEQRKNREFSDEMANFLIDQAQKWSASDLRDKAIEMLGAAEYLRRKIAKNYSLWECDKEMLVDLLSNYK